MNCMVVHVQRRGIALSSRENSLVVVVKMKLFEAETSQTRTTTIDRCSTRHTT